MPKLIHNMRTSEITSLTKSTREKAFREASIYAVAQSILYSNLDAASKLLKILPLVTKKYGAQEALIEFFEKWANVRFDSVETRFQIDKKFKPEIWTDEYATAISKLNWADAIPESNIDNPVIDADKEIRKVLERLNKAAEEPRRVLLHSKLLHDVEAVVLAYGRTDAKLDEEKRGRTLYDRSTQMKTMRAGKFAKGS